MPSFFVFKILKIKITSSWIFFVEKTENADFTDFQTRILSYNQRESAFHKIVPRTKKALGTFLWRTFVEG